MVVTEPVEIVALGIARVGILVGRVEVIFVRLVRFGRETAVARFAMLLLMSRGEHPVADRSEHDDTTPG